MSMLHLHLFAALPAALTLVMLPLGVRRARQGRMRGHRATMLWTAGGLFVAGASPP